MTTTTMKSKTTVAPSAVTSARYVSTEVEKCGGDAEGWGCVNVNVCKGLTSKLIPLPQLCLNKACLIKALYFVTMLSLPPSSAVPPEATLCGLTGL